MIVYAPLYNEMPWTPYFLRSLLEYDCPIVLGEGASDVLQFVSQRSTDGTLELVRLFADRWKDRVHLHYHDIRNRLVSEGKEKRRPRHLVRNIAWNMLKDGDWLVCLDPDNYYDSESICKLRGVFASSEAKNAVQVMAAQRVFVYNFHTVITQPIKGLCGPWISLWPLNYKKDPDYHVPIGDELVFHKRTGERVAGAKIQKRAKSIPGVLVDTSIQMYHYKGIKAVYNRYKRYGKRADAYVAHPLEAPYFTPFDGEHPKQVRDHIWMDTKDCRLESDKFDWRDFVDIVTRP